MHNYIIELPVYLHVYTHGRVILAKCVVVKLGHFYCDDTIETDNSQSQYNRL